MKGYLLDTHILIWLLEDNQKEIEPNIREDIEYYQYTYYASIESLREIVILQSLKKIQLNWNVKKIVDSLENIQINILSTDVSHIAVLEKLPILTLNGKRHEDPFDRMLISQAIAGKYTIISSDSKFPFYKEYGLKLLINQK